MRKLSGQKKPEERSCKRQKKRQLHRSVESQKQQPDSAQLQPLRNVQPRRHASRQKRKKNVRKRKRHV